MIEVQNLKKIYRVGEVEALRGISFRCSSGITAIIGPNGAGKTTTVKILAGLLNPSEGEIYINGKNVFGLREEFQAQIGYVGQFASGSFQYRLTAKENLYFFGKLKMIPKNQLIREIDEYMGIFDVEDFFSQQFSTLSGGQRQILAIIRALLGSPKLIFLDEPTRSLDPVMAQRVRKIAKELSQNEGQLVIITSHNMYELEEIADHLLLINKGRLIFDGTPSDFRSSVEPRKVIKTNVLPSSIIENIIKLDSSISVESNKEKTSFFVPVSVVYEILKLLPKDAVFGLQIETPSLEHSYVKYLTDEASNKQ